MALVSEESDQFRAKISHRTLLNRVSDLKSKLKGDALKRFKESCFGHFLELQPLQFQGQIVLQLLFRQDSGASNDKIIFYINGTETEFGASEFALITGLHFGPKVPSPPSSKLFNKFFKGNDSVRVRHIEEAFDLAIEQENGEGDSSLKLALLYVLYGALLVTDRHSKKIDVQYIHLVDDLAAFNAYPWGRVAHEFLIKVTRSCMRGRAEAFKAKQINKKKKQKQKNQKNPQDQFDVYGFAHVLQIWAYEVMPKLAGKSAKRVSSDKIPRMLRWTAEKILAFEELKDVIFFNLRPGDRDADHMTVLQNIKPSRREANSSFYQSFLTWQKEVSRGKNEMPDIIVHRKRKIDDTDVDDGLEREKKKRQEEAPEAAADSDTPILHQLTIEIKKLSAKVAKLETEVSKKTPDPIARKVEKLEWMVTALMEKFGCKLPPHDKKDGENQQKHESEAEEDEKSREHAEKNEDADKSQDKNAQEEAAKKTAKEQASYGKIAEEGAAEAKAMLYIEWKPVGYHWERETTNATTDLKSDHSPDHIPDPSQTQLPVVEEDAKCSDEGNEEKITKEGVAEADAKLHIDEEAVRFEQEIESIVGEVLTELSSHLKTEGGKNENASSLSPKKRFKKTVTKKRTFRPGKHLTSPYTDPSHYIGQKKKKRTDQPEQNGASASKYDPYGVLPEDIVRSFEEWWQNNRRKIKCEFRLWTLHIAPVHPKWFDSLCKPNMWLADEHVDALVNLALHKRNMRPDLFLPRWTCTLNPFWHIACGRNWDEWCAAGKNNDWNWHQHARGPLNFIKGVLPDNLGLPWAECDKVYGIAHVLSNHWVLYELVIDEQMIIIYDSLSQNSSERRLKLEFKKLANMLTSMCEAVGVWNNRHLNQAPKKVWTVERYEHPPQQTNSDDCGVMCGKFLETLAAGQPLEKLDPARCPEWRMKFGAELFSADNVRW